MVLDKYRANLAYLVGFCFSVIALKVWFLFYAFFSKNVMTAPCSFFETKSLQKFAQILKTDICIWRPLKNLWVSACRTCPFQLRIFIMGLAFAHNVPLSRAVPHSMSLNPSTGPPRHCVGLERHVRPQPLWTEPLQRSLFLLLGVASKETHRSHPML